MISTLFHSLPFLKDNISAKEQIQKSFSVTSPENCEVQKEKKKKKAEILLNERRKGYMVSVASNYCAPIIWMLCLFVAATTRP
jgi:hypothetical protein